MHMGCIPLPNPGDTPYCLMFCHEAECPDGFMCVLNILSNPDAPGEPKKVHHYTCAPGDDSDDHEH
jgi:hypothetical protein